MQFNMKTKNHKGKIFMELKFYRINNKLHFITQLYNRLHVNLLRKNV